MFKVRVPATSANLGAGFDSLGLALSLYNEYEFSEEEEGLIFEGVEEEFKNEDNIIFTSMKKAFEKYSYKYKGIKIKVIKQDIPISRGLGSSSSCIVAGLVGALSIMGKKINKDELLDLAVDIEGHPDNVCPAIFGGATVSVMNEDRVFYNNINIDGNLKFVAMIPDFTLSTKRAREVLPKVVDFKDAVYNLGRTALLVSCLCNGKYELLNEATSDRLHQIYRSSLIKGYNKVYNESIKLGALGFYLSGAGPTLMAIVSEENNSFKENMDKYLKEQKLNWDVIELTIDKLGAEILKR